VRASRFIKHDVIINDMSLQRVFEVYRERKKKKNLSKREKAVFLMTNIAVDFL
jgi:hypothetical protein